MTSTLKKYPKLYKYTTTGQVQEWQIFSEDGEYWTIEGIKDGKLTKSLPTICEGKNAGRSNETDTYEQAEKEAQAKWQKKVDSGYNETLTKEKKFRALMLAKDAKESKDLFKKRTFVQPKLDGLRCANEKGTLMSRNGKPFISCPHLYQHGHVLDGELYSHEYHDDFNKIVSLCKKQKPTAEEIAEAADKVEFWMYDCPESPKPFSGRYEDLKLFAGLNDKLNPNHKFRLVPTYEVKNWDEIKEYHENFLSQGYEGTIIRIDLGPYEGKRSKQLLKYKDFMDAEFKVIGYEEGEGGRTGTIGKFFLEMEDGRTFKSNVKGDFDYLRQVWADRATYMGATATVKFFNYTPDTQFLGKGGVPRFPYVIKLKREEYE